MQVPPIGLSQMSKPPPHNNHNNMNNSDEAAAAAAVGVNYSSNKGVRSPPSSFTPSGRDDHHPLIPPPPQAGQAGLSPRTNHSLIAGRISGAFSGAFSHLGGSVKSAVHRSSLGGRYVSQLNDDRHMIIWTRREIYTDLLLENLTLILIS